MTVKEKADRITEILNNVGVKSSLTTWTNGGCKVTCKVEGKTVEIEVSPSGEVSTSKYTYKLPGDTLFEIEKLGEKS